MKIRFDRRAIRYWGIVFCQKKVVPVFVRKDRWWVVGRDAK